LAEFEASTGPIVSLTPRQAAFHGNGGALFGISLKNVLLTLLTVGIYYFWGKNRTRTYLVGQCEFEGDRFAWYGTGKELFLGTLKLLVIAAPVAIVLFLVPLYWKHPAADALANLVVLAVYVFVGPLAAVGARRYRMSRLSWRGIRFSFRGRVRDLLKLYLRGSIFTALTLGLYYPFFQTNIRKFVSEQSYFGTTRFAFDGKGRDLFGRFLLAAVVAVGALGIAGYTLARTMPGLSLFAEEDVTGTAAQVLQMIAPLLVAGVVAALAWLSFMAYRHRYYWNHTSFGTARFRSTMTAGKLLAQSVTNLLLLVVTLGLAFPWVIVRNAKFALANVGLVGSLDLAGILQEAQAAGVAGESLADFLNVDLLGLDLPL